MVLSDFYTFFEEIINTILHRKYNLINFRFEKNFVFSSIDLFSYLLMEVNYNNNEPQNLGT